MKLECEVLAVETTGDQLIVRLQGARKKGATWRRKGVHSVAIDDSPRSQKAFHVGRKVSIVIKAE